MKAQNSALRGQLRLPTLSSPRKVALSAISAATAITFAGSAAVNADDGAYQSPYQLQYTIPKDKLLAPDAAAPRNSVQNESSTPYTDWYADSTKERYKSWGPEPTIYFAPDQFFEKAERDWRRQRLAAIAEKMIGLAYQHHHIPDWSPPADWPWKEVSCGADGKGLDCSNFTSWLYNYGLGIKISSNVHKQAELETYTISRSTGSEDCPLTIIRGAGDTNASYYDLVSSLKTGDLLYIRNRQGEISHVIMWLGSIGKSPDNTPLIVDCTDMTIKDNKGLTIPKGVQIRPFKQNSWYFINFSHAHRILAQ